MLLKNISGESREFEQDGIIYEFPYPAKLPTRVPDNIAVGLLKLGQFEKVDEIKR